MKLLVAGLEAGDGDPALSGLAGFSDRGPSLAVPSTGEGGAGAGGVAGLLLALGASRFLEGLLFGVEPADPLTFGAVAAFLAGVAFVASRLPARRVTAIDPTVAMRGDG